MTTNGPIKILKGVNGQLEVYPTKVVIKRKGLQARLNHGFKGDKTILIKHLTSVQVKPAGAITGGYIQFSLSGGNEARGGLLASAKDENSVNFNRRNNESAQEIQSYIEEQMNAPVSNGSNFSVADELTKLKSLMDGGVLTQEEFEAKKKQLLAT